jgi:hypothetical protein
VIVRELRITFIAFPALNDPISGDEFRHHDIGAQLFAERTEDGIRDSSHWSQKKRERDVIEER